MSMLFAQPEEKKRLPYLVLYELNEILDESKPLPRRAALLVKWMAFFHSLDPSTPIPSIEELTPGRVRELAQRLVARVAAVFSRGQGEAVSIG